MSYNEFALPLMKFEYRKFNYIKAINYESYHAYQPPMDAFIGTFCRARIHDLNPPLYQKQLLKSFISVLKPTYDIWGLENKVLQHFISDK